MRRTGSAGVGRRHISARCRSVSCSACLRLARSSSTSSVSSHSLTFSVGSVMAWSIATMCGPLRRPLRTSDLLGPLFCFSPTFVSRRYRDLQAVVGARCPDDAARGYVGGSGQDGMSVSTQARGGPTGG